MGKRKAERHLGSKTERRQNDRWEKDSDGFDRYCSVCGVYYPASSNVHNGH